MLAVSLSLGLYKRAERDLRHGFMADDGDRAQSSGKAAGSMLSDGHRAGPARVTFSVRFANGGGSMRVKSAL